jgi:hypothetical protein
MIFDYSLHRYIGSLTGTSERCSQRKVGAESLNAVTIEVEVEVEDHNVTCQPVLRTSGPIPKFWQSSYNATTLHSTKMLTEHFVASISTQTKANTGVTKDVGIFLHEFQPLAAQRHVFKNSATAPSGLAMGSSHVFAAQQGKGMVHYYNRDKSSKETLVPFPERIYSLALAAKDTVLLLGTESGRVLAWEVSTMRHAPVNVHAP